MSPSYELTMANSSSLLSFSMRFFGRFLEGFSDSYKPSLINVNDLQNQHISVGRPDQNCWCSPFELSVIFCHIFGPWAFAGNLRLRFSSLCFFKPSMMFSGPKFPKIQYETNMMTCNMKVHGIPGLCLKTWIRSSADQCAGRSGEVRVGNSLIKTYVYLWKFEMLHAHKQRTYQTYANTFMYVTCKRGWNDRQNDVIMSYKYFTNKPEMLLLIFEDIPPF